MHGELWRLVEEQGFVVLAGVLTAAGVEGLRVRVEELFEAVGENAGHEFQRDAFVRRVAADEGVRALLGGDFVVEDVRTWSLNPYAPLGVALGGEGVEAAWLLDDTLTGDGAVEVGGVALPAAAGSVVVWRGERGAVWRPNATGRHIRMVRARVRRTLED